jgi:hypothetical protein
MPTSRPRHQVTETPEVALALDVAAQHWPGEPRSRLLLRLLVLGREVLEDRGEDERRRRRDAIDASSGKYEHAFSERYLEELRSDWPA